MGEIRNPYGLGGWQGGGDAVGYRQARQTDLAPPQDHASRYHQG